MSLYFFDSSALVKRYLTETGTNWVRQVVAPRTGNRIFIAHITPIEMVSGLARKQREAGISARTMQAAMLLIDRHAHRDYVVVRFSDQVEQQAKVLLTTYPLRAYDAVQLASAMIINQQLTGTGLIFVSGDVRLLNVVAREGLPSDNPNNHP